MPPWARWALLLASATLANAQGIIRTLAGTDWNFPSPVLPALAAPLGNIQRMALAPNGDLYVADPDNNMVFRIDRQGTLSIAAGNGISAYSGDNGPATSASLSEPSGVAVDGDGNLYIADSANHRIRKVAQDIITTLAGNGTLGYNADGIPATSATLFVPQDIAVSPTGDIYIADTGNYRVRKVTAATGLISTYAGTGAEGFGGDGGPATAAIVDSPQGLYLDSAGRLYIAQNRRVRRVSANGIIETIAGIDDYLPAVDGIPALQASLGVPEDVAIANDVIYIADSRHSRVRRISPDGIIGTITGGDEGGFSGDGGQARQALLYLPRGVAADADGNVYIADTLNSRVRRVAPDGVIQTLAGNNGFKFGGDGGPASAGLLHAPGGLVRDPEGNIYVAELLNHRVRKVSTSGEISTVAGDGFARYAGDGGPATGASLNRPSGLALDAAGRLYIGDSANGRVRRVDLASGIITTFAGGGSSDPPAVAASARLDYPSYLTFDKGGNLYVAQPFEVLKITPAGAVTVFAGNGTAESSGNGGPATAAAIEYAGGIVFDAAGNFYVTELYRGAVRRITPDGRIDAYAGNPDVACCRGDGGPPLEAGLSTSSLAIDDQDSLYIGGQGQVRKLTASGALSTLAGATNADAPALGDGGPALRADLKNINGLAVDAGGNIYLSDAEHDRVRQVLNAVPPFSVTPELLTFTATSGGSAPVDKTVLVTSAITNLPYQVTFQNGDGNWLSAEPPFGLAPGLVTIGADPAGLAPGQYEGTVSIFSPDANPPLRTVVVRLTVTPASAPSLTTGPNSLLFEFVEKQPSDVETLVVRNDGAGSIPFTAQAETVSGGDWLSVSLAQGTATAQSPAAIAIRANPGQLPPGTYLGSIVVTAPNLSRTTRVPVTMVIHSSTQTILIPQHGVTFTAGAGTTAPLSEYLGVINTGLDSMNWTAAAETTSGGSWLSVTPSTGASGPGGSFIPNILVRATPAGLAPGDYYGRITVSASGAANSPQVVSVILRVVPANQLAYPDIRPTGLLFTGRPGGPIPTQDVLLTNVGAAAATFRSTRSAEDGPVFFTHQPSDGSLPVGRPVRITVGASAEGLPPGIHRGRITVEFAEGNTGIVETVLIVPRFDSTPPDAAVRSAIPGCTPTKLVLVFSLLGQQFQVPAAFPAGVEVRVADDCGEPFVSGSVRLAFSNGDPPLSLVSTGGGYWSGTWQAGTNPSQVRIVATATSSDGTLRGTTESSGAIDLNTSGPVVQEGAIVSAASFAPGSLLAPGGLVTIFGDRLSAGIVNGPVPRITNLNGTQVLLGSRRLPLIYVSPTQVNALVPYSVPVNTTQQLLLMNEGRLTLPFQLAVAEAQPAIFSVNGQATILTLDGAFVNETNPVKSGDILVIYCAGLGAVDVPVVDGAPAPIDPLARTIQPVDLSIGGKSAQVLFAGLTPGNTGLYQINAVVPLDVPPGSAVPLVISIAGQTSPEVTIPVRE